MNRRAQVTIFIIIAIILVVSVGIYFIYRGIFAGAQVPASLEPVYTNFLSCLERNTLVGIDVLESQGGYIEMPEFEPGSGYMPFSSQLNFLGNAVPYWYYVSGNNIEREQVPSTTFMEEEIGSFVEGKIRGCVFDSYYEQGFEINLGEPKASVDIKNNEIEINLNMNLEITKGEDTAVVNSHKVIVNSQLGKLYASARKIYDYEQSSLFLENYAVDMLSLYAPVDGVELTCSPMNWDANEIFDDLENAIEANTLSLKVKGGDFSLREKDNEYFVVDIPVDSGVRFLNSKNWSHAFEVNPSDDSIMMSNPVGNQPGLGILGFCYVPYHFVYDVGYPVLVQVYEGEEIFQFPLAVVVRGNRPREPLSTTAFSREIPELCKYENTLVSVNTYDTKLNRIEADISYRCFGTTCSIGETTLTSPLDGNFPQCVNGYIVAKAEGYANAEYIYSTTQEGSVDIIMDKLYEMGVNLNVGGSSVTNAVIFFNSDKHTKTIVYPDTKRVNLTEGSYEIQVQVYGESAIKLEETTHEQCMDVPQSGVGGLFGLTSKKCFEINVPSQIISNALVGGGKQNYYILESELEGTNTIEINAPSLPVPKTIEDLQNNNLLIEGKGLDVVFK